MIPLYIAAAATAAFNLACSGTSVKTVDGVQLDPTPFSTVLRIDLAENQWCGGDCRETGGLASIENRKLTLIDQNATGIMTLMTINRESGAYLFFQQIGKTVDHVTGKCERRTFTGFPPLKF